MFPFIYSPTYQYPLSGDVIQDIAPVLSWKYEGLPEVEYEVYSTVASPGKQLGKLCEAVLALADEVGLTGAAVDDVRKIVEDVKGAKVRAREAAEARAEVMAARAEKLKKIDNGPEA